eukprot:scaffold6420_cov93-Isochrysis_galbana.AAC.3
MRKRRMRRAVQGPQKHARAVLWAALTGLVREAAVRAHRWHLDRASSAMVPAAGARARTGRSGPVADPAQLKLAAWM